MICKFYVLEKFEEKLIKFLNENLTVFQRENFENSHKIIIIESINEIDSGDISPEDIYYTDAITIDVFEDHIDCYKR